MKKFFFFILLLCVGTTAYATHLLGGEIQARNISGLTYDITGVIYLDNQNGRPAADAQTEISFCLGDGTQMKAERISSEILPGLLVNRSVYRIRYTYPAPGQYTIATKLDNLTSSIINLGPVPTGGLQMVIQTTLNTTVSNSTAPAPTPTFTTGLRQVFLLPLATTDPDGDSLAYRLVKILVPGQECAPNLPSNNYIFPNEVTRQGTFRLDRPAAKLVWNAPAQIGLYTYAYVTEEWRQGVKIAESWRTNALFVTDQNSSSNPIPPFEPVQVEFEGIITALPPQEFLPTELNMVVYPVPSHEYITVEVSTRRPSTSVIELVDLQGRVLQKKEFKMSAIQHSGEFSVGTLPKGMYLIRARSGQAVLTRKFVR
ncbi:T9SS type A sorting domain-containing protein [Salmonirosea aquatica]|uniref:T9SS type A sorting domain-containing protein n=1 Tax=Salmonirosea aquatica TaxID=2654236 RepID=A0A7C9BAY6_9BACT|nr:T9SS type A sorting domain-containing protein [Cytophagaceae bacterium SJW1-29]